MRQFFHGLDIYVAPEMVELGRRDAPLRSVNPFFSFICLLFLHNLLSLIVDGHFMEPSKHIPTSDVFKTGTSLNEEAARREFKRHFFPLSRPEAQTRIPTFTMNSHEANIVVEAGKNSADIVLV